jgi:hypothetical protein
MLLYPALCFLYIAPHILTEPPSVVNLPGRVNDSRRLSDDFGHNFRYSGNRRGRTIIGKASRLHPAG